MNAVERALARQTMIDPYWVMPIVDKYRCEVIVDGIRPHFDAICNDVRAMRTKLGNLPITTVSNVSGKLKIWNPRQLTGGAGEFKTVFANAMYYRHLVRQGLSESLQVYEGMLVDATGCIIDESVNIRLVSRQDELNKAWLIEDTGYRVVDHRSVDSMWLNPMMYPWNTNEQICEYWKMKGEYRKKMLAHLDKFVQEQERKGFF